uniref:Eukaryotic translation initiation factor 4 gamma, 3b n=1 Tax=Astyanax mexicanus TaxID=7994 RepID=A0A8B9JLU0_ASTMX
MSLPPKAVPKPAAPAGPVPGPGTGPPPSTQLRAPLATVQLPGPPVAQQPPPVPPTQVFLNALHPRIPRVQPPLDERLFSTQPGVTAVYSVQRPPGPPYTAHELNKGHPSLAATPPGHASSPGLSQSPYTAGQNAGTTPLVYSPPTQPMNAQPQSRPFFQRTQMQTARPTIPSNNPSIRAPSQAPTATVYTPSQPIMISMTPMPFPSPQTAQSYIPQVRRTYQSCSYIWTCTGLNSTGICLYTLECIVLKSSSPGLRPGEPPLQRREPSSPAPIAPTPPAPVPAPTPVTAPAPAPAQDLYPSEKSELPLSGPEPASVAPDSSPAPVQSQSPSPALALSPSPAPSPSAPAAPAVEAAEPPVPLVEPGPARVLTPEPEKPEPTRDDSETSASPDQAVKAVNGLAESDSTPPCNDSCPTQLNQTPQLQPAQPSSPRPQLSSSEPSPTTPDLKELKVQVKAAIPVAGEAVTTGAVTPTLTPTTISAAVCTTPAPAPSPSPSLTHPGSQGASETGLARRASNGPEPKESGKEADVSQDEKEEPSLQSNLKLSLSQGKPRFCYATIGYSREGLSCSQQESNVNKSSPEKHFINIILFFSIIFHYSSNNLTGQMFHASSPYSPIADPCCMSCLMGICHLMLTVSPLSTEPELKNGKRQYNRDFLLGFQFMPACVQKPEGLPPISDVVLDKINQNKLPLRQVDPRVISRGPDFTPAFADFGRMIPGSRGAPLLNVGLRRPPPRKIIMNVSVNDEVQLKKAENAWKPGMKRDAAIDDPENLKTQELFRKVRSILNKLTPQMFNQLMKQVTDLTIDTEERLKGVIDLVFEKAIDEPSFSVAYGNMCSCLATLKVPMADKPTSTVNFRKLLLNRCQKEFEKDKMDDDVFEKKQRELEAASSATERERLQEELEEAKDKARRRSIGNIKFIGELFKLRMLTEAIMHDCVVKLLKNHDEESLECLCRLLTTIGKDLDFEKAKPRMDQYFNQMEKIVKERKTSSRIRFMLQDVIDLRLHNWVSRRADQGPKTIEQIHKEAKIEEQEEQRKVHQQLLSKDKRRPVLQREETWNTVPVPKNSRTIDPSKIPKISKPPMDDKIQLGPRAQLNWMKGSSGGAGAKASESDVLRPGASSLNRYSPLQPSPPAAAPASSAASDFDSKRSLSSRGSSGRERNDKPLSSGHPRPGPLSLAGAGKEAPEEPPQEEVHKETQVADTPKLLPSTASRSKLELKLEAASGPATDKPALSEEEMEKRSKSIIDEFLHINDYKEAVQCVEELEQASMLYVFVRVGVESTLERSQITRDHMGQLFHQLLQAGSLSKPQFFKGFSETLELADDMAIDIPHIWLYLAELVNPVLREGGISMRELFSEFSKPLLPVGRAGILFSEILHLLCKQMSHRKVGALWKDSGLSWADFLPETEDVNSFITEQKLDFTLSDCSSPAAAVSNRMLSPEELNKQLEKLLLEDLASDEQIFDWVEANLDESEMSSPPFLRALMTAVCKAAVKCKCGSSYRVDTAIIQKRLPVLHKYLNSDTERQLQALYALQALIVKLEQPPNLLRMFFDCLYDEDVISEDAFYKWESSKDPAEQQGKGVALKSVTAFFTWLREAEEESEDN